MNLGALLMMLYGTAPLLYGAARYSWTYKYIGVVQYINLHGHLNTSIDIYQNFPGFFAFAAWFDKVIGVQSPLAYAKWAQLAFEALTCLMLHFVFRALPLTDRERWFSPLPLRGVDMDRTGLLLRPGSGRRALGRHFRPDAHLLATRNAGQVGA